MAILVDDRPKYIFTEKFVDTIKTSEITSEKMDEVFSFTMDFLIHCGFTKETINEMYEAWSEGYI